jgi:hypothetical protein
MITAWAALYIDGVGESGPTHLGESLVEAELIPPNSPGNVNAEGTPQFLGRASRRHARGSETEEEQN